MGCACDNYARHKQELSKHHHHINCNCDDNGCGCSHEHTTKKQEIVFIIRIIISTLLLISSIFIKGIFHYIFLIASYLIISYDIFINAFKNIIKGKIFDENMLMLLASLTALLVYIINKDAGIDGFDGVVVAILYQLGEYLQHKAVEKSRQSIDKMLQLNIEKVILVYDGKERIINPSKLKINDVFKVLPGEKIPTDGIIVKGSSSLNTSMITGESKPLDVYENDKVVSGCINNDGVLFIKATTTIENSTTSKVIEMIKEASKNKAEGEKFISSFAKYYTPIVILISFIVAFVIPLIIGFDKHFIDYLYKGLTIMVISCPCALVISIPLSYFISIGKAARNSILVKGSSYIEKLSKLDMIVFDKTGTLTKGNFKVKNIVSDDIELFKNILYSFEKNSTHPIGKSIYKYLKDSTEVEINDLKNIPGYGMEGYVNNFKVLVGNKKLLIENNINFIESDSINNIIYVAYNNEYLGYIELEDEIKQEAYKVVKQLKDNYDVCLISGDKKEVVSEVSSSLNIDKYYYQKLPNEKAEILNEIKTNKIVAYVGDGINDAACLLNSDVGISMRSLGSDIAIQASNIVIMDDNIANIKKAIDISKKTTKTVKFNIIMSILLKVIVMTLTMIIKLPMWVAIIADVGVCLITILNSLTIMYGKYLK